MPLVLGVIQLTLDPALMNLVQTIAQGVTVERAQLDRIESKLDQISLGVQQIMATEQQALDALKKIDTATTAIAANVQTVSTTTTTIATGLGNVSTEIDNLLAALKNAGVSQAVIDSVTALGTKVDTLQTASQGASDALAAQVPVLEAIAAKGVTNPVPVPPPPPPGPAPTV